MVLGCFVCDIDRRMPYTELRQWMAFFQLEPIPNGYHQAGIVASTLANLFARGRTFLPSDFMPKMQYRSQSRHRSVADALAESHAVSQQLNAIFDDIEKSRQ